MKKDFKKKMVKVPKKLDDSRGISVVIYGNPGVGKTTMAGTLPAGETLIINTEAGLGPLLGSDHVVFNLHEDLKGLDQLYQYLLLDDHPFKNVVIDNLSDLQVRVVGNAVDSHQKKLPEIREYGDSVYKVKAICRNFLDLVHKGINVVFNAWEAPMKIKDKDGVVESKMIPDVFSTVVPKLVGWADVCGHLEVSESGKRWVRIGPSNDYITKVQFAGLDPVGEPADFPTIIEKLRSFDYSERGNNKGGKNATS